MVHPGGGGGVDIGAVACAIDHGIGAADGEIISLGAKRRDVVARDDPGGELFGSITQLLRGLFVAEENVRGITGPVVAPIETVGSSETHLTVEIQAAIQLGENVEGRGIGADRDVEWSVGEN